MHTLAWIATFAVTITASVASAAKDTNRLTKDWLKLAGSWVTPFRKDLDRKMGYRLRLTMRKSGENRLFEVFEGDRTADGKTNSGPIHSAVIYVFKVREKDHHQYIVVGSSGPPPTFVFELQYEFVGDKLKLKGAIGSSRMTGEWSRLQISP